MSDVKKYYYMRLKENFFDTEEIKIMETMADGYLYSNILLKMYLASLKNEGRLMLNNIIPYNAQMIAGVTGHQVGTVEKALDIFKALGLIEVLDNGAIYMMEIQNYIGKSTDEADRKRDYDRRIAAERKAQRNIGEISEKSPAEIEKKKEQEIEQELEIEKEQKINYQQIADMFNEICVSFPRVKVISHDRAKAIKARLKTYSMDDIRTVFEKAEASAFLKGGNNRNWSATFDWMMKDANMAKILDGNYDTKPANTSAQKWNDDNENIYNKGLLEWVNS